jgi:hypothetical protein
MLLYIFGENWGAKHLLESAAEGGDRFSGAPASIFSSSSAVI